MSINWSGISTENLRLQREISKDDYAWAIANNRIVMRMVKAETIEQIEDELMRRRESLEVVQ